MNKLKKTLALVAALGLACTAFVGCGSSSDDDTTAETDAATTAAEDETTATSGTASGRVSEYLSGAEHSWMLQVQCDGVTLTLPMDYSVIEKEFGGSVTIDNYSDRTFTAGVAMEGCCVETDKYDSGSFKVGLKNYENESKEYTDCSIYEFEWNALSSLGGTSDDVYSAYPEIILPENITWGSTVEEIKAAYGEDCSQSDSDGYTSLRYSNHYNDSSYFFLYLIVNDDFGLSSIEWAIEISGIEYETEEETSSNSEGWLSEISCDDITLTLPMSNSVLEELGCTIDWENYSYKGDDLLEPSRGVGSYYVESDKYTTREIFQVDFRNNGTESAKIKDCDIVQFEWNIATTDNDERVTYDAYPTVILPNDITWGSTLEEIESAYGEADSKWDTSDMDGYYLTYSDKYNGKYYRLELRVYNNIGLAYIAWDIL